MIVDDGRAVADPFHPSDDLVALLRVRATALTPRDGGTAPLTDVGQEFEAQHGG
jgi:hypothetical protein